MGGEKENMPQEKGRKNTINEFNLFNTNATQDGTDKMTFQEPFSVTHKIFSVMLFNPKCQH